jgi:EmrB/QacA subfamily drug resistance transporter
MTPSSAIGRRIALLAIVSAQFLAMLDSSILNVALPSIRSDFALTSTATGWILNAYFLTFGGFLLLSGRAADLFGRRRMFLLGSALLVAASALAVLAPSAALLIAARMLQGLGAAALTPAALSLLIVTFTGPAKAKAMSAWGAASAIGGAAGVSVGGLLVGAFGWHSVFLLTGLVSSITAIVGARRTPRDAHQTPRRFDVLGAVTVTGTALALVFAILSAPDHGLASPEVVTGSAAALVLGGLFVLVERRAMEPIVPLDLFRSRALSAGVAINLLGGAARIACFFLVALYLQEALRYSPSLAGTAMLPTSIAGFGVSMVVLPRALVRWGATRTMITGLLLVAAAQLWLSRGPATSAYAIDVLPALFLAAAGVAFSFTPTTILITRSIPAERSGVASGMASASAQLGGALGIATFSAIQGIISHGLIQRGASVADATAGGFAAAFASAGTAAVLAAVLAIGALTEWRRVFRTFVRVKPATNAQ